VKMAVSDSPRRAGAIRCLLLCDIAHAEVQSPEVK
jgi:hypothetical protein